jgi:prepilin signal peptidase PulO-like enzyme (type II secretory pathway)
VISLAAVFIFLFGLAIGSFLNVVIYRFNTGVGINGRSGCMTCNRTLAWYELIPVVSFLIQCGRCRGCKTKLSLQYPLVELLTGLLFLATFVKYVGINELYVLSPIDLISFGLMLVVWSLLVVILVYDLKHKIIPDSFALAFAIIGFVRIILFIPVSDTSLFYSALLAGPLLFLPFFVLWYMSDGKWIGLGDGKLSWGIGWMLGLGFGISAIVLAFWIGAVVSCLLVVIYTLKSKAKQLTMKSEIPFAPYLILGFTIVYFFAIDVMGITTLFHV